MLNLDTMTRSSRAGLRGVALFLALALSACAGKQKGAEEPKPVPKPPTEPMAWMPADANMVARVVLEPFRTSPLWSLWSELQEKQAQASFTSFIDLALVDAITFGGRVDPVEAPAQSADQAAALPVQPEPHFVAAIQGRFGEGYLQQLAAAQQLTVEPRGLLSVVKREHEQWAQVSPELLIAFSHDMADRVVARAGQGDGAPIRDTALYKASAERVAFEANDLALLVEDTSGKGREALRENGAPRMVTKLVEDVVRGGISVDMGELVVLKVVAEAKDEPQAKELEESVRKTLESLASNLVARMFGLGAVLSALKTSTDANYVRVDGSIRQQDLEPLLHKLSAMLQLAADGGAPAAP